MDDTLILTELRDMRKEQRDDHRDLSTVVTEGFAGVRATLGEHDTRITVVEGTRKTLRWLAAALVIAALPILFDMVVNHLLPKAPTVITRVH